MTRSATLILSLVASTIPSPCSAAYLVYSFANGRAYIDPTEMGSLPNGKVYGYNLASNGKFFVDPARQSVFPSPAQTFFENTASVIGDNDFTFQGTSSTINLGQLFTARAMSFAEVEANLTNRIYVGAIGGGESTITVYRFPEPGTATLSGLVLACLLFARPPRLKAGLPSRYRPHIAPNRNPSPGNKHLS